MEDKTLHIGSRTKQDPARLFKVARLSQAGSFAPFQHNAVTTVNATYILYASTTMKFFDVGLLYYNNRLKRVTLIECRLQL